MASYYDTLQWYQSRRFSAVLQKYEKEIEMETEYYPSHHYNQPRRSGIYGTDWTNFSNQTGGNKEEKSVKNVHEPKNIHESIDHHMTEIRRMIADMTSKKSNYSDFSSNSVSKQQSTFDRESQHLFDTKSMRNFQVPLESGNSELHKQYKVYSSYELNEKRDRGICLLCDEYMYQGHKCCKKKKFYVFEIDVDDALEVSECNEIESPLNEELVETKATDFDKNLIGDSIQTDSILMKELSSENENEREELSEIRDKYHKAENEEYPVFDELPNFDVPPNVAEKYRSLFKCFGDEKLNTLDATVESLVLSTTPESLCLSDSGCRKSMALVIANQPPKDIGSLFILVSILEIINHSWVGEPELPLPPPEPPPRML